MKPWIWSICLFCGLLFAAACPVLAEEGENGSSSAGWDPSQAGAAELLDAFNDRSVGFVENAGQFPQGVRFRATAGMASAYFLDDAIIYTFARETGEYSAGPIVPDGDIVGFPDEDFEPLPIMEGIAIKFELLDRNEKARPIGRESHPGTSNYVIGNNPDDWQFGVRSFESVVYENVYDGIDLKFSGNSKSLKYDFVVHPGADPNRIRVKYHGVEDITVSADGELQLSTAFGLVKEKAPVAFSGGKSAPQTVSAQFQVVEPGVFGFEVDKSYDRGQKLTIDPELIYGSFLGGTGRDAAYAIARFDDLLDNSVCVTGYTWSVDFDITGAFGAIQDANAGQMDAFVTRIDLLTLAGQAWFSTYFGGSGDDWGLAVVTTLDNSIAVAGMTNSPDFPTWNAWYDTPLGATDGFIFLLSEDGQQGSYSTYFGGSDHDVCFGIDKGGSLDGVFVAGMTLSDDLPTDGSSHHENRLGAWDGFVSGYSNGPWACSYIGGSDIDVAYGVSLSESADTVVVAGMTRSKDLDLSGSQTPHQATFGGVEDAFVMKYSNYSQLEWGSYLGGSDRDYARAVDHSSLGAVVLTGRTWSDDFYTTNLAYDRSINGECDAFATSFSGRFGTVQYSTYLGGEEQDYGRDIEVDTSGYAYVTGRTESLEYPTVSPYDADYNGGTDVFVTKVSTTGTHLIYSTFLGGAGPDYGRAVAADIGLIGQTFVAGITGSADFPTTFNAYDSSYDGALDAFLVQFIAFDSIPPLAVIDSVVPGVSVVGSPVAFGGHGADSVGDTLATDAAEWISDVDGFLNSAEAFVTNSLSQGRHRIGFRVRVDEEVWSQRVYIDIVVDPPSNTRPSAFIDSIAPNPADPSQVVFFGGHGDAEDVGDQIVAWSWDSPGLGHLSDSAEFDTTGLPEGRWTIYYKVQDLAGDWSNTVWTQLDVTSNTSEEWLMTWADPTEEIDFEILMQDWYTCTLAVRNLTENSQLLDHGMKVVRLEGRSWDDDPPVHEHSIDSQVTARIDSAGYSMNDTVRDVVLTEDVEDWQYSFSVDWNWIKEWDLLRLASIVNSVLYATVWSDATQAVVANTIEGLFDVIQDFAKSCPNLRWEYTGVADVDEFGTAGIATVRPAKIVFYWSSYLVGYVASEFTSVGYKFAKAGQPWPAVACFVVEAVMFGVSEWLYVMAVDPRADYDEIKDPPDWEGPSLDEIEQESPWKDIAVSSVDMYRIGEAACSSYARYLVALKDGVDSAAIKQLGATYDYVLQQDSIVGEIKATYDANAASIPTDTVGIYDSIDKGLPEIEEEFLEHIFNYGGGTWTDLGRIMYDSATTLIISSDSLGSTLDRLDSTFSTALEVLRGAVPLGVLLAHVDFDLDQLPFVLTGTIECWIEYPEVPDLTGYDLVSAYLEGHEASFIWPTPADHDGDGFMAFRVEFALSDLAHATTDWRALTVTGEIAGPPDLLAQRDTVFYSGSATVVSAHASVCCDNRSDINHDGHPRADISDLVYLVSYMFSGGPAPPCMGEANVDGSASPEPDIADLVYLVNHMFAGGPAPVPCP